MTVNVKVKGLDSFLFIVDSLIDLFSELIASQILAVSIGNAIYLLFGLLHEAVL